MHMSLSLSTAILITATAVLLVAVVLLSPVNKASAKECINNNNNAHSTTCSHEEYSNNHDPSTPKDTIPLLLPFP
jgi:hypothetical protein